MSKHTVKGALYLYVAKYSDPERPIYHFQAGSDLTGENFVKVVDHSFDVEIPEDFDPIPGQIAGLNEKKRQMRVQLAEELSRIDERISNLSAIEYDAPPAREFFGDEGQPFA